MQLNSKFLLLLLSVIRRQAEETTKKPADPVTVYKVSNDKEIRFSTISIDEAKVCYSKIDLPKFTCKEDSSKFDCCLDRCVNQEKCVAFSLSEDQCQLLGQSDGMTTCHPHEPETIVYALQSTDDSINKRKANELCDSFGLNDDGERVCISKRVEYEVYSDKPFKAPPVHEMNPLKAPHFLAVPKAQITVRTGETLTLQCRAGGNPEPGIEWIRMNAATISERMLGEGSTLQMQNIGTDAAGSYKCIAFNVLGDITSNFGVSVAEAEEQASKRELHDDLANKQNAMRKMSGVRQRVHNEKEFTQDQLGRRPGSSHEIQFRHRLPVNNRASDMAYAAEIYYETLSQLGEDSTTGQSTIQKRQHAESFLHETSNCTNQKQDIECSNICCYRSYDGTCNNLQHKLWGAAITPYLRILESRYEDNLNRPNGWDPNRKYHDTLLPNPRLVSEEVLRTSQNPPSDKFTLMLMQWGQFLDHDITFTPLVAAERSFEQGTHCNVTCVDTEPCFPIQFFDGDPRKGSAGGECMGFTRSASACPPPDNLNAPREQFNQITAFIDASNVYGSSTEEVVVLKDPTNSAFLDINDFGGGRNFSYPPAEVDARFGMVCQPPADRRNLEGICLRAGDKRANEQVALTSMHTLFIREHNRIAQEFIKLNPQWSQDKVFQEARKLIGGMMQYITFDQWLPIVLAKPSDHKKSTLAPYSGYQPTKNPTIRNEFATAAFRFGHGLIMPVLPRLNENYQTDERYGHLPLHQAFFDPTRLIHEGGVEPILRGLIGTSAKAFRTDAIMSDEVIDKLFQLTNQIGLDLGALNIQRGRDHALQPYVWYVEGSLHICPELFPESAHANKGENNLITSMDQLKRMGLIDDALATKLDKLYEHVENIDLFVGLMAETKAQDAFLGPTIHCIIQRQFENLRDGDRFYYERQGVFTQSQRYQIKQGTSLAAIICDNTASIQEVPPDVFRLEVGDQQSQARVKCDQIPRIDLTIWCQTCEEG